jgi:acyl-CoA reductase-like NAD-dependent aldehyde dehydrogenase
VTARSAAARSAAARSAAARPAIPTLQQYIGGAWVPAGGGREFTDTDPWDGHPVAVVPAGDAQDAVHAVDVAAAAFATWGRGGPGERQRILLRAADVLDRRSGEVLDWLAAETGCGMHFGAVQLEFTLSLLRQAAGAAYAAVGQVLPSDLPGAFAMAVRRPVGVVAAIAPWNAALVLSARSIAAPLALGNTVVLKPSEESPFVGGVLWAEVFEEAGLPPGVLNVVTHAPGEAGAMGTELVAHPRVRRISFTGSTATGRRLAAAAGQHLKRIVLELGGHNPLIVLADADPEYAVDAAIYGAFLHQGQICMCARRILVERTIATAFLDRLAMRAEALACGDPRDERTVLGPLINRDALATVSRRVQEAVAGGARLLAGGRSDGPCYTATVIADVPADCELARLETFGPVAMVEVVDSAEDAVRRANDSAYGLAAGILTGSSQRGLELSDALDSGIVHINDQPILDEPQMPFGGVKDSGWGRFGVPFATEEFTELRWVTMQQRPRPFPF